MRTLLHLKPGKKGTKQLLAQYGDRLVCVRYRYDAQRKKRFKTVELIVAASGNRLRRVLPLTRWWECASASPRWSYGNR
jgi:hypothetical protein